MTTHTRQEEFHHGVYTDAHGGWGFFTKAFWWTEFRWWHVVAKRLSPTLQTTIMGLSRDEILEQFEEFRKEMDEQNDKRERLIKASQATPFSPEADVSD